MDLKIITINNVDDILRLYPKADTAQKIKIKKDVVKDIEDAKSGNRIIYGVQLNGEIVGTIQLIFKMEKDCYANCKTRAHLHHARVLEKFRGQGIGSQLVKIAENEARKRRFKEITLGVEKTNVEAIKLYEKRLQRIHARERR